MENSVQYDDDQLRAIHSTGDTTLVLAGAGSGKTRTLVGRIRHFIEERNVPPGKIVALTFTNAAAKVLQERVGAKLGYVGTLHSLLLRVVNREAEKIGWQPGISVVDPDQAESILVQIVKQHRYTGSQADVEAVLRDRKPFGTNPSKTESVVLAFRQQLKRANTMTFDDLLHYGQLAYTVGCAVRMHVFCDEVQDTSDAQMAVYDAMPKESITFCGDRWQSIFGFIGGNVGNIGRIEREADVIVRLETNYRCCKRVCAAATNLIAANGGKEKTVPRHDAPEGVVEEWRAYDSETEIENIAKKIRELKCERNCAVLLRRNDLVEEMRQALAGYGIPVSKRSGEAVPRDWRAVKALVALLANVENDLLAEAFIAAIKDEKQAAKSKQEAGSAMSSINEQCLHFPQLESAQRAVGYVAATRPTPESLLRLKAACDLLPEDASIPELLIALAQPEKQDATAGVVVSTVHSAKGLEFSTVFVAAAEEGILPSTKDARDPDALAEAARLFYVAVTRAEQNLFISSCKVRQQKFGRCEEVEMEPSRFIAQCGVTI